MSTLLLVLGSLVAAEFIGYWLHVLLHSAAIPALSKAHMNHHLLSYAPWTDQRRGGEDYIQEVADGHVLIAGLGLEWIIPSVILIALVAGVEWLIGLSWTQIVISEVTIMVYCAFLFWWLHDRMHVKGHWLLNNKLFRKRFLRSRKFHDIHHHHVNDAPNEHI